MTGPGSRSADPADGHGHGAVGPLVDEAALLLTAVEDKLQAWQAAEGRMAGGAVELPEPCPECGTVPGAACTGCPVCRLIAAVRGERPEVTARVVDGDRGPMFGWLPSWRWTPEMNDIAKARA